MDAKILISKIKSLLQDEEEPEFILLQMEDIDYNNFQSFGIPQEVKEIFNCLIEIVKCAFSSNNLDAEVHLLFNWRDYPNITVTFNNGNWFRLNCFCAYRKYSFDLEIYYMGRIHIFTSENIYEIAKCCYDTMKKTEWIYGEEGMLRLWN